MLPQAKTMAVKTVFASVAQRVAKLCRKGKFEKGVEDREAWSFNLLLLAFSRRPLPD